MFATSIGILVSGILLHFFEIEHTMDEDDAFRFPLNENIISMSHLLKANTA